jgi:hypothetical protein
MNKPIQLISALGVGMVFILAPLTAHAERNRLKSSENKLQSSKNELLHLSPFQNKTRSPANVLNLKPLGSGRLGRTGYLSRAV